MNFIKGCCRPHLVWLPLWAMVFLLALPVHAEPVAKVGSWVLTLEEVDRALAAKIHEMREKKVQELILEHVLTLKGAELKIAPEQVVDKLTGSVATPSDEAVKAFIQKNKEQLPNGGEGLEEQVKEHLMDEAKKEAEGQALTKLLQQYAPEMMLKAPRFTVPGPQDLSKGDAKAAITIIEFSDFECPYCRRAQAALKKVQEVYGDKVRMVFRHYPLPFHTKAPKASEAAQCAADQGKFWPMHDLLFNEKSSLELADLKKAATTVGLDQAVFDKCLDSGKHAARITEDLTQGKKLGVTGTPTFFVNGVRIVGAQPFEKFKSVIDDELKEKEKEKK
ncbi:MAG: DsbA family protein [Magnetococcales bacterium]|nr:DsbA family protein [Magnetococcales bacterium]MBF0438942.1 DsbA family protein [Magnetococcales bacterium]